MNKKYLYRGVSVSHDGKCEAKLSPKLNAPFIHEFNASTTEVLASDTRVTMGPSEINAVHLHQASQKGYPTSGISTTPHKDRARVYAQGVNEDLPGYIYTLDRDKFAVNGISEYIVSDYVANPAVPQDDEVILVAQDLSCIPEAVIIRKERV